MDSESHLEHPELYLKKKKSYFEHIKGHQTLEKLILERNLKGQRNRGRPKIHWEKDVKAVWGKCLESGTKIVISVDV